MSNPASFATAASQDANTFTGTQTLASGVKLLAGANELVGTVADKLNSTHLAQPAQVAGDLLVASSATAMARLPDVAVGQVLKSGGVGVAPAYSAIGGTTAATAPAFTGAAAVAAAVNAFTGTGFATAGQVVTTTDNQTMTLNQCAGMWLITATQAPCLIVSNTAVVGAPAVLTVYGAAPVTNAQTYRILTAPTPAGTVASHAHGGTGLT